MPCHGSSRHRTCAALLHGDATVVLVRKLEYLVRGPWDRKKSAVAELNEKKLRQQRHECLPTGGNGVSGWCKCLLLYKRAAPTYPVAHVLFFTESDCTPGEKVV
ncbi:hypothetical protein TRVL_03019 [Trypanosoma vivax]|nr:hypothetical protein TRVL_03019 [Trypanosoma vivax]